MGLPAASRTVRLPHAVALTVLMLAVDACGSDAPPPWARQTASPHETASPLTEGESRGARRAATLFLDAFLDWDGEQMWEMLLPQAQARWSGQEALSGFLARKFGTRRLVYELGEPRPLAGGSIAVPITIDFEDSGDRLTGPPLVLALRDSLAVSDAGPLGPRGPVIGSPAPARAEVDVPILIYHHVAPQLPADYKQALDTVTTTALAEQLSWLAADGYASITLAELFNAFYYDLPLPPKPVVLVFDDGYVDAYLHAFPLLKERGFGATVAAISGAVGSPAYLTWEQVEEMSAAGIEFVSHTVSHGNLAAATLDEARAELADSRRTLEDRLGRPVQLFVYPYGEPFVHGSPEAQQMVLDLLRETGYIGALTTTTNPPYVSLQRVDAPYQLRRIPISGGESLVRFAASIKPTPSPTPSPPR